MDTFTMRYTISIKRVKPKRLLPPRQMARRVYGMVTHE